MKYKDILLGMIIILIGCLYLGEASGYLPNIGIWEIAVILGTGYGTILMWFRREYIVSLIFLAILLTFLKRIIEIPALEDLSMVTMIIAAVILGIGLQIIFKKKKWEYINSNKWEEEIIDVEVDPENDVHVEEEAQQERAEQQFQNAKIETYVSFGSLTKYVDIQSFEGGEISCSFGELTIDLRAANLARLGGLLNVRGSCCEITLIIPRNWAVQNQVRGTLAEITDSRKEFVDAANPCLLIRGDIKVGEFVIKYI
ncbi:MAG: LiaF transmembrane domain-containing protein [Culicoidibacterales bacterium]